MTCATALIPQVEQLVMVQVQQIADMGAYVKLVRQAVNATGD